MNEKKVKEMTEEVRNFCTERDWDKFHNAKDLAIGISTEANELLDIFRFKTDFQIKQLFENISSRDHIEEEVADILFFLLRFSQMNDIDLDKALENKLKKNALKYPVEKARGSNAKYNEFE